MMFPTNTGFAESEHVPFLDAIHLVENGMVDLGLQLTCKTAKDFHLDDGHESQVLQSFDVMADRSEVMVKTGKAVIRPAFSSKMLPSQVCLPRGEFGQGLVSVSALAGSASMSRTLAGDRAEGKRKIKLGHYRKRLQLDTGNPHRYSERLMHGSQNLAIMAMCSTTTSTCTCTRNSGESAD